MGRSAFVEDDPKGGGGFVFGVYHPDLLSPKFIDVEGLGRVFNFAGLFAGSAGVEVLEGGSSPGDGTHPALEASAASCASVCSAKAA